MQECMYVWTAMRFVVLRGMEVKFGMGVGAGPTRFDSIFSKSPYQRSKVIQRSSCFRNALWPPNLVGLTSSQRVMHCWDQRSFRVQLGSTRVTIGQECQMATKFGRKNPWPKSNAFQGSNVMQGLTGVNQGSNCTIIPKDLYGFQRKTAQAPK